MKKRRIPPAQRPFVGALAWLTPKYKALESLVITIIKPLRLRGLVRNDAQGLLIATVLLTIIGFMNDISASYYVKLILEEQSMLVMVLKQLIILLVSVIIGFIMMRLDYTRWKRPRWLGGITLFIVALLLGVIFFGTVVNGAKRWIDLVVLTVQPSEFAKLGAIMWAAHYLSKMLEREGAVSYFEQYRVSDIRLPGVQFKSDQRFWFISKIWLIPIVFGALIMKQPDMGTTLIVLAFPWLMMLMCGFKKREVWLNGAILVGLLLAAAVMIKMAPYRFDRILAWLDPLAHQTGKAYQTVQSMSAISKGFLWGQGFGQGVAKFDYLPEAPTDFAFAVWAQETGLIGSAFLLILYGLFLYYGFRIASRSRDMFGSLVAYGFTMMVVGQAVANIAMVCGAIPVSGVPLPFISHGGSSLMMNMAGVGLLISISRRSTLGRRRIGTNQVAPSIREETKSRFISPS